MAEPDFESIMKKYRSLMGPGAASPAERQEGSASQQVPINAENTESSEQEVLSAEDAFLDQDRYLRAPLASDRLEPPPSENYENLIFNSLFAQVEQDEWTPQAVIDRAKSLQSKKSQEIEDIDLMAADFARRLYHYEMDLRQHYNPDLGMYPGQALYIPKRRPNPHAKESDTDGPSFQEGKSSGSLE